MDDSVYTERLNEARKLQDLITSLGIEHLLYLEFDSRWGVNKEKFDFCKNNECIYSVDSKERAEDFIMGFYFGG